MRWKSFGHVRLDKTVPQCNIVSYVKKKLTAIRLKPEQVKKLEKLSSREDLSVSWLIRKAIDEFLKRKK